MACRSKSASVSSKYTDNDSFNIIPDTSFTQTSVLVRAIYFENVKEVDFLLKKGSDPNKPVGNRRIRPLMMACFVKNSTRRLAIFKSLFRYQVDPELTDIKGQNCLMYTCALKLKDELQVILDNFVCSFYNKDDSGNTLLHICAKHSTVDVMDVVLDKMFRYSMNINIRNNNDHTPLDLAILQKNIECADKLFKVGSQSTLLNHRNGPAYFESIKDQLLEEKRRGKLMISTHSIAKKNFPPSKQRDLVVGTTRIKTHLPDFSESEKMKSPLQCDSPSHSSDGMFLKDPEEALYQLLEIRAKRAGPGYSNPSQRQVPLDADWVASTRDHLHAIAAMERYVLESGTKSSSSSRRGSIRDPAEKLGILSIPKDFPACLWKKVLVLNTTSRSLSPSRHTSKSTEKSSRLMEKE